VELGEDHVAEEVFLFLFLINISSLLNHLQNGNIIENTGIVIMHLKGYGGG
jgi:hypothetical protein